MQGMSEKDDEHDPEQHAEEDDEDEDDELQDLFGAFVRLSSPKPGHTTGGSGRRGARRMARRVEARQNRVPTFRSARKRTRF